MAAGTRFIQETFISTGDVIREQKVQAKVGVCGYRKAASLDKSRQTVANEWERGSSDESKAINCLDHI